MFFIPEILSKKGPLALIWMAAHDQRLSKNQIQSIDLIQTVDILKDPQVKFSLPIKMDLIAGMWKIHRFHNKYLLESCQHLVKSVTDFSFSIKKKSKGAPKIDEENKIQLKNVPEILDLDDFNVPKIQTIFNESVPVNSFTIRDVPPPPFDPNEITDMVFGDEDNVDWGDDFKDLLSTSKQHKESESIVPQDEYYESVEQHLEPTPSTTSNLKHSDVMLKDILSNKQTKKRIILDDKLESLELLPLNDAIQGQKTRPKRFKRIPNVRRDTYIQISLNELKRQSKKKYIGRILPDIFHCSKAHLVDIDIWNEPCRSLGKQLKVHFDAAIQNNTPLAEFQNTPMLTTTIEPVLDSFQSGDTIDDFFAEPLPSPNLENELPQITDDLDKTSIPRHVTMSKSSDLINDQLIVKQLDDNLVDLFSNKKTIIKFDQLKMPKKNRRSTSAMFFAKLLEMKNQNLIELIQEPSLEQFNPVFITKPTPKSGEF